MRQIRRYYAQLQGLPGFLSFLSWMHKHIFPKTRKNMHTPSHMFLLLILGIEVIRKL